MAAVLIAGALTAAALFLPPISLPDRLLALSFTPLTADSPAVINERLIIALPPAAPATDFAIKLDRASPDWLDNALAHMPAYLSAYGEAVPLQTRGDAPDSLLFDLALPADSPRVALYGWDSAAWRFIPAQLTSHGIRGREDFLPLAVGAFVEGESAPILLVMQEIDADLEAAVAGMADILAPAGLRPVASGALIGSLAPGGAVEAGYAFMPLVRNFDDAAAVDRVTVAALLTNPDLRAAHVRHLRDVAAFNEFAGFVIDYRGLTADLRAAFADFVGELGNALADDGLSLGVVIPGGERDVYDWAAIGAAADYVIALELADDDALLHEMAMQIPRRKLLLGMSVAPVREVNGAALAVGWHEAFAGLGDVVVESDAARGDGTLAPGAVFTAALDGMDAEYGASTLGYVNGNGETTSRIRLTDAATLGGRLARLQSHGIGGVAFDDLLAVENRASLLPVLRSYAEGQLVVEAPSQFSARWTIQGAQGVHDEIAINPQATLVATIEAPEGLYAVNWTLMQGETAASSRGGAVAPIFRATPTPTPPPTAIPTTAPVVSAPIVEDSPPAQFVAAPMAVGSITIELGGQVQEHSLQTSRAINAMRQAGMNWVKIQIKYSGSEDLHGLIQQAHGQGFKILISAVGYPDDLRRGGQGYMQDFARWLGRVAEWGADAIEVWNEPNLDREWPPGQISGTMYTVMLRLAYQEIKARNPNALVISAAPAPTGAAIEGRVVPDNKWLREVVAAGGVDYMDCVGVHYNEGIVPPSQTSGDPRGDDYYTRFFNGMLVGYLSIIPDRPLCFTELGYVTSDGYGPLPSGFAWGANTTVQQQAAWLAEAAIIASNSGAVRLFIVWNIDFTRYDSDPQGGYAIIRKDGSCPACQTLAAAR